MWAAAILVTAFALHIWWTCRGIRADFADEGLVVSRIRWLPLARFFAAGSARSDMLYRVWFRDRNGEPHRCIVVATFLQGFTIEEPEPDPDASPSLAAGAPRPPRCFTWVALAVAAGCCLTAGVPYWRVPYNQVQLPDGLIGPGLVLLGIGAAALQFWCARRWRETLAMLGSSMVAVVMVRVVRDTSHDPSTHNLFPFEVAIAAFCGLVVVGAGLAAGTLLRRVLGTPA